MPSSSDEHVRPALSSEAGVIAVVAGSGLVTNAAVDAGVDLIFVLNAGLYRSVGVGSLASFLPFGNPNEQTERLLTEQILPRAGKTPVVAGVWAADETRSIDELLERYRQLGVYGVVNWPAVGFVDGVLRAAMEEAGVGVTAEANLLRRAADFGLAAFGFALAETEVALFRSAGVRGLVLDVGLTRPVEDVRQKSDQLQQSVARLNALLRAAGPEADRPLTLAFGGPITTADDLEHVFRHSRLDGFAGGSVFDRLPIHETISAKVRRFKSVVLGRPTKGVRVPKERPDSRPADGFHDLIGRSAGMRDVFQLIRRAAPFDVNICIEGESGTGKELVATALHRESPRASRPFVTLNCGAIPETLIESELFGHERGAFTGADRRRLGKFELARGGTLFLDEIADLSPRGQVAILRALQQREITRVGSETTIPVDVRIVAASNQPLLDAVNAGRFRADLYFRLNYLTIEIPALRDRLDDLDALTDDILRRLTVQLNRPIAGVSAAFREKMRRHNWRGNVRELQHVLGQAALREDSSTLDGPHFTPANRAPESRSPDRSPASAARSAEKSGRDRRQSAEAAVVAAGGNVSVAARSLGVTRRTIYAWLKR